MADAGCLGLGPARYERPDPRRDFHDTAAWYRDEENPPPSRDEWDEAVATHGTRALLGDTLCDWAYVYLRGYRTNDTSYGMMRCMLFYPGEL